MNLCKIGIHEWELSRPLNIRDIFPPFYEKYDNPKRDCTRCGKHQRWLPGYGGSEDGCWLTKGVEYDRKDGE